MLSALLNGGRAEPFGIDGALAISLFAGRVRLAALQIHAASQGRVRSLHRRRACPGSGGALLRAMSSIKSMQHHNCLRLDEKASCAKYSEPGIVTLKNIQLRPIASVT